MAQRMIPPGKHALARLGFDLTQGGLPGEVANLVQTERHLVAVKFAGCLLYTSRCV